MKEQYGWATCCEVSVVCLSSFERVLAGISELVEQLVARLCHTFEQSLWCEMRGIDRNCFDIDDQGLYWAWAYLMRFQLWCLRSGHISIKICQGIIRLSLRFYQRFLRIGASIDATHLMNWAALLRCKGLCELFWASIGSILRACWATCCEVW